MELMELVHKAEDGDVDFLREGVAMLAQALMEAEVTEQVGVGHGQRDPEGRSAQRNGYRDRDWDTRAGEGTWIRPPGSKWLEDRGRMVQPLREADVFAETSGSADGGGEGRETGGPADTRLGPSLRMRSRTA
jgi:hypothetical protein